MSLIKEITLTKSGVLIFHGINPRGQEDWWYIHEGRMIKALDKVGTADGLVMQTSRLTEPPFEPPIKTKVTIK